MSLLFAKLVVYLVVALRVVTLGIIALDRPRFLRIRRMFIVHRWLLGIEARYRGWRDGRLGIPRADEPEAPPEVWKLKRQGDGVGRRIGAKWVSYDLRLKGETQGHEVERRKYARKQQALEVELYEEDKRYRERRRELDRKVRDDERRHADDRWRISTPVYVGALLLIFIGEFPLNAVAFNLFGEERVLTWVMTTALAASLIVCAHALGVLWRKQRPTPRDELIAKALLVSPFLVILGIGLVRQVYVTELDNQTADGLGFIGGLAVFVVMNALIFVAAFAISYLHHDPETHGVDRVAKDVRRAERRKKRAQRSVDRADWLTEHFDNLKLRWEAAREGSLAEARFEAYRHKDTYEALIQAYWSANRTVGERRAQKRRSNWDRRRRQHGDEVAGLEPQPRAPFEPIHVEVQIPEELKTERDLASARVGDDVAPGDGSVEDELKKRITA